MKGNLTMVFIYDLYVMVYVVYIKATNQLFCI